MGGRVKRGQVWWVDLGEPRGSEPGLRRPVVIVQDDLLTTSRLKTVMVVPLTSNMKRAVAVGNVALDGQDTGLPRESVALTCQVTTVDKSFVTDFVGALPRRALRKVDEGMALALGLDSARAQP
jgi:mRNA interferase MazF